MQLISLVQIHVCQYVNLEASLMRLTTFLCYHHLTAKSSKLAGNVHADTYFCHKGVAE